MTRFRLIIILSLWCCLPSAVSSQSCDRVVQAEEIQVLIRQGDFEGAKSWLEEHSSCSFDSTDYRQWLLDFEISRNLRKSRSSLRAAESAAALLDDNAPIRSRVAIHLALAEAFSMRRRVAEGHEQLALAKALLADTLSSSVIQGQLAYNEGGLLRHDPLQAEASRAAFREAIQLLSLTPDAEIFSRGLMLRNLGNNARNAGDFPQSVAYYQQELELYQANYPADHTEIAFAYYHIGAVYYELQDYQLALDNFLLSYNIWKDHSTTNNRYWRYLCEAIGDMYWELADRPNALQFYDLAAEVTTLVSLDSSGDLSLRADTLLSEGRPSEALFYYQRALDFRIANYGPEHPLSASCHTYVAKAKVANQDTLAALVDFQMAIMASARNFDIDNPYANPDPDTEVVNLGTLLEAVSGKGDLLLKIAQTEGDLEQLKFAASTLQLGIDLLERLRRKPLSEGGKLFWNQRCGQLIEAALQADLLLYEQTGEQHYLERAFLTTEKGNSFLLLSALRTEAAIAFANVPAMITEREHALRTSILAYEQKVLSEENRCQAARENQLDLWREKLSSLRIEYDQLLHQIEGEYPQFFGLKFAPIVSGLNDWQTILAQDNMALLSYFQGEDQLYAFLLSEDTIQSFQLIQRSVYQPLVQSFLELTNQPHSFIRDASNSYRRFCRTGHQLYELLLAPALAQCSQGIERLVIIPTADLAKIPFSLLLQTEAPSGDQPDYRSLPYLLRKYAVSYASSATIWLEASLQASLRSVDNYHGFATNVHTDSLNRLSPLNYATEEIVMGQRVFGGRTYLEAAATETIFRKQNKTAVLHLATHTLIDDELPLQSSLLLAADSLHDGYLQAFELYELSLNSQLAILSACATASGEWEQSEGLVGLERAFQYAGTPALLTTFWPVDDLASASMMQYFLEELSSGQAKDLALQQAQLRYLRTSDPATSIPYLWGAYRLTGDARPLRQQSKWVQYWWLLLLLVPGLLIARRKFLGREKINSAG